VFWIRNTVRNVTMVVAVFIINCQVSLNPTIGPVAAHTKMISTAAAKVLGCPTVREVHLANRSNKVSWYALHSFIASPTARRLLQHKPTPLAGSGHVRAAYFGERPFYKLRAYALGCFF
jgi:hypothetical protein